MWPSGAVLRTRTRSPTLKHAATAGYSVANWGCTFLYLFHFAAELRGRDDAALDQRLRERADPFLVVREPVVRLRRQRLDVLAQLVHRDAPRAAQELHHRIHAPLPLGVVVLGRLDLAGRQPAHVVVAPLDHATHSDTGALASCSGWQTMSTSVGSPAAKAAFNVSESLRGSVTFQLRMPNADATAAWSVALKSTEK